MSLPGRSIQTPQEVLLLHLIEQARDRSHQRLEYLNDPYLGPESTVAKGDWQLWIDKLQLMKEMGQWQNLFEVTCKSLKRARTKNIDGLITESRYSDWVVWDNFREAAKKLNQKRLGIQNRFFLGYLLTRNLSYNNMVFSELEAHLDPASGIDKPWRRNAAIIWLDLTFDKLANVFGSDLTDRSDQGLADEDNKRPGRASIILEYLQKYGHTSVAFEDIRPYVESLQPEERSKMLSTLLSNVPGITYEETGQDLHAVEHFLCPQNQDVRLPETAFIWRIRVQDLLIPKILLTNTLLVYLGREYHATGKCI